MNKSIILTAGIAGALVFYFSLSLYVFPGAYQIGPRKPEAVITNTTLSTSEIKLGESFIISVTGTNRGEEADMQIISIGFPNLTRADNLKILKHDFAQAPIFINPGRSVGSQYTGLEISVAAQYEAVEASNRPWPTNRTSTIQMEVTPPAEGKFVIFLKAIAFPHSWDGAHWPQEGIKDHQKEFVKVYEVSVTNP